MQSGAKGKGDPCGLITSITLSGGRRKGKKEKGGNPCASLLSVQSSGWGRTPIKGNSSASISRRKERKGKEGGKSAWPIRHSGKRRRRSTHSFLSHPGSEEKEDIGSGELVLLTLRTVGREAGIPERKRGHHFPASCHEKNP